MSLDCVTTKEWNESGEATEDVEGDREWSGCSIDRFEVNQV
jgi:hypothetical protein